ncbi:MAG: TonB-dependent receptor [Acidobacteria bacterium]|nr:TonB-dependent receptor [Acidobacteriota bacterium]
MQKRYLGAAAVLAFVATGFSQTTSTTILGTITDPTGASVAGAKITATNIRTQVKRDDVSSSTGDYSFPLLDIGEYSVTVQAAGFKTVNRAGLVLQINEKLRADITLQVGQVSERVEVTGSATALKTDEASIGDVIEQRRIVELPVNGRNVGNLAVLQAGVMFGSRGGLDGQSGGGGGIPIPGQTIAIVANGQRETSQHATLDGVVATEARVNTVPFSPSPEAIEEVKVFTGTYSAEYGFNSGAQLIMVMRSGTNDLHGSLFEFLRNDKLDAEGYFQNYFNTSAVRLPKQGVRQNQFGFVVNGPVLIPKLYNGKDKTFFMFNYEGRRRSLPGAASSTLVPTDEFRAGDFSQLLRIPAPVQIVDPLTGTPFAGNILPASRISNTSKSLLPFWEKQQVAVANPQVGFNYTGSGPNRITDNQYFMKFDHNFSTKDKIMGRYAFNKVDYFTYPGTSPQFSYLVLGRNDNIASQWIHVFSPAAVLETRYGFTRSKDDSFNPRANTDFNLAALGMDGFRVVNDGNRTLTKREVGLPAINLANGLQSLGEADGGNGFDDNKLHQLSGALSLSKGAHNLKVGAEYRRISLFRGAANVPRGAFNFTGNLTGHSFAQFMLGLPSSTDTPEGLPLTDVRQNRMGFYVTDDYKVGKKLTLNIGVRYEYNTMATDVQGLWRSAEFAGNTLKFVPDKIRTTYDFYKPQKNMFMPRVGLAYRASENWVIRAGYGMYYNVHQLNNYTILNLNPPLSGSANFSNDAANNRLVNTTNPYTFANPFGTISPTLGTSANVLNTDNFQPQVNQWSFDVQRRLPFDMSLNVGYVGSKTSHLDNTMERNSPDPAFNTPTSSLQSRRPYPFVNDNGVIRPLTRLRFLDSGGNSTYQGLQMTLQKRFKSGLSFSIAHTFSKSIMEGYGRNEGDGYNPNASQNPRNRRADRGRVGFDVTHNVVSNFVYELPFFKSTTNALVKNVLGGWQTNGVVTMRTGFPMTVTQGAITNTANVTIRPDRIGLGSLSNPTVNQWFNPNDFRLVSCQNTALPELCRYGNSGMGILEGPGAKIVDFSLFKNFQIFERVKLQFRSEMYNLFNTPQFARPNGGLNTGGSFLPARASDGSISFPSQANQVRGVGAITSLVSPMRQIQFGLKLLW